MATISSIKIEEYSNFMKYTGGIVDHERNMKLFEIFDGFANQRISDVQAQNIINIMADNSLEIVQVKKKGLSEASSYQKLEAVKDIVNVWTENPPEVKTAEWLEDVITAVTKKLDNSKITIAKKEFEVA